MVREFTLYVNLLKARLTVWNCNCPNSITCFYNCSLLCRMFREYLHTCLNPSIKHFYQTLHTSLYIMSSCCIRLYIVSLSFIYTHFINCVLPFVIIVVSRLCTVAKYCVLLHVIILNYILNEDALCK